MVTLKDFFSKLDFDNMSRSDEAIALLWYFSKTETEVEKTIKELADILEHEGYGRPNVTKLKKQLIKSKYTVKGRGKNEFRINTKYKKELNDKYLSKLDIIEIDETPSILPKDLYEEVNRKYTLEMIRQINTSYNIENYDCCVVMVRRLMESSIIDVYQKEKRIAEIKFSNGAFFMLDKLIDTITTDPKIILGRNIPGYMKKIKELGDTAAHNRTYITSKTDVDDEKTKIRKTINELFILSNIIDKK